VAAQHPNTINETTTQSATSQTNPSSSPADKPTLEHAVQRISEYVSASRPEISFTIDETTGTQVVKIVDSQSKQVIRQMPSEEAIQIAQALDKLQGLFVKDKA
jgi:flagellar protein FlaG